MTTNVGFLFAGPIPAESVAKRMVESVRLTMPDALVWQLTDFASSELSFVDEVQRVYSSDLVDFRFQHLAKFPEDLICIDYDCIVQRDLTPVFDQPFDLAFTRRGVDKTASESAAKAMPHNLGVIFQRPTGKRFWARVAGVWASLPNKENWLTGQVVVSNAIKRTDCRILELPGEYYNYTPETRDEDVRARAVVHYKGNRKHWMVDDEQAKAAGQYVNDITERGIEELTNGR